MSSTCHDPVTLPKYTLMATEVLVAIFKDTEIFLASICFVEESSCKKSICKKKPDVS